MVSVNKALTSLLVSGGVVAYYLTYYQNIADLTYLSPALVVYCVMDLRNSWDMVAHHLATICLNVTFGYVYHNLFRLTLTQQMAVTAIVEGFFLVEVSTIWLALLHLGIRHWIIKVGFFTSFAYYRVWNLTKLLWNGYHPDLMDHLCYHSTWCQWTWYVGSMVVMGLNYYWFALICHKLTKRGPKLLRHD